MRILHIISGLGLGGAESTLYNLVKYDYKKNTHIIISLSSKKFYEKKLSQINVKVINLDFKQSIFNKVFKLIKIINNTKPHIVQSWMYHAEILTIIVKILTKSKIVWNIRNSTPYSRNFKLSTKILVFLNSIFSYFIPQKIISCSTIASKNHINIGYDRKKFINIFNGVDIKRFKIRNKIKKKKEIVIGCVARWHPQKDHKNLIKSLNLLIQNNFYDWKCFLVGKGLNNKNKEILLLIKNYKLNKYIKLLGPLEKINHFYNKIDFFVLPSRDGEGFPNVLAESYASGVMCISTDVGDANKIINEKKYLVKPGDEQRLYESIKIMINDNKLNNKKNKMNLRNKIKRNFSMEKMIKKYNTIWSNA